MSGIRGPERIARALAVAAILVVLAVFVAAGLVLHAGLSQTIARQEQIRHARVVRAELLALQLDEETGVRGYAETGVRAFLEPYFAARARWDSTLASLQADTLSVRPQAVALVEELGALNREWTGRVATPTIARTELRRSVPLALVGKSLADRFRTSDDLLDEALDEAAIEVDRDSLAFAGRVTAWSIAIAAAVMALLFGLAASLARTARDLRIQRVAYEEEKRVADMLQEAFVQKGLPQVAEVALDAVYAPAALASAVGGDWYDAFELPDGRVLFTIGDVAGHGVEAAVTMSRVRQALLSIGMTESDPAAVLAMANKLLALQQTPMVTAVVGFIVPATRSFSYAAAGHPPPIHVRQSGDAALLPFKGPPLGIATGAEYRTFATKAQRGDMLVLYTDGVLEQDRNLLAGERRLLDVARLAVRERTPAEYIFNGVFGERPPADDVAIFTATFAA